MTYNQYTLLENDFTKVEAVREYISLIGEIENIEASDILDGGIRDRFDRIEHLYTLKAQNKSLAFYVWNSKGKGRVAFDDLNEYHALNVLNVLIKRGRPVPDQIKDYFQLRFPDLDLSKLESEFFETVEDYNQADADYSVN